jgi:hypothetical protein
VSAFSLPTVLSLRIRSLRSMVRQDRQGLAQSKTPQHPHQGRDQKAQNDGERDRNQYVPRKIQQRQYRHHRDDSKGALANHRA